MIADPQTSEEIAPDAATLEQLAQSRRAIEERAAWVAYAMRNRIESGHDPATAALLSRLGNGLISFERFCELDLARFQAQASP
jgi:hypothetical protein